MSERKDMLERITAEALDRGLGSKWARLAELSTGAVIGSAVLVGGATLLQRSLGPRGRRWLAFVGGAAAVPLALLALYSRAGSEPDDEPNEHEAGDESDGEEGEA